MAVDMAIASLIWNYSNPIAIGTKKSPPPIPDTLAIASMGGKMTMATISNGKIGKMPLCTQIGGSPS